MSFELEVKSHAREEIADVFKYYEEQKINLGFAFLDKVEDTLKVITKNPKIYQEVFGEFRQVLLVPFPYLLIFEIEAKKVIVYQVINARKHPRKRYKK